MQQVSLGRFGDTRLEDVGMFLHSRLVEGGGGRVRVRQLGGDRAGEMRLTRFLRNDRVTVEEMAQAAASRLASRCAGRHVLAIQDTTVVRSQGGGGLYLHPVLAVDAEDGAILGLAHAQFLSRSSGKKSTRRTRTIEDKESYRWVQGAEQAGHACSAARQVTMICDSEGDIYEVFARQPTGVDLLVRAAQDRNLADGGRLFDRLDATAVAGHVKIELPARPGRRARDAHLVARFAPLDLARPRNGKQDEGRDHVMVNAVDVREIDPPLGEVALHWRLITTHPVRNAAQAFAVANLYRRRWLIEQVFRTLKTQGFDIEGLLIEAEVPLCNLVMATLIAAVSVQQLVHARDGAAAPGSLRPATDAFEPADQPLLQAFCAELEGKTERQKNPHPIGSLAYAAWVCARLGGWTGYYGKPGPIVTLRGWIHFQIAMQGATLMTAANDV